MEQTIRRPRLGRVGQARAVTTTRCDRKVLIGCTEIENLDQHSDLGMTEMEDWVRPKYTKKFWKFKSDESGTPSAPHTEWFKSDLIKFCDVA